MLPYDSRKNPFNDPHLDKVFVWKKKAKKLGWSKSEAKAHALAMRERNMVEIENAKRRRVEREEEIARKLEARERVERERDSASYAGWEQREEEFMLKQNQQASALRINQGRERPIDALARNVLLTKQLRYGPDIGPDGKAAVLLGKDVGLENESPLGLFKRLSQPELEQLRDDLAKYRRLEGESGPFAAFWSALIFLCEDELKQADLSTILPKVVRESIRESCDTKAAQDIREEAEDAENRSTIAQSEEDRVFFAELASRLRVEVARATVRACHEDMVRTAKEHGRGVHNVQQTNDGANASLPARMLEEDEEDADQVETSFNDLVDISLTHTSEGEAEWVKPRYWNRVRMGFDWNKYNRAHYDKDNLPPKVVIGYKFNILYHGLKKTPFYRFERDAADPENYCVLRFCASYPYSDIAFRIEKREWERGSYSGYKNSFENGVLQLHFNFTRRRYRR